MDGATIFPLLQVLVPQMKRYELPMSETGLKLAAERLSEQTGVDLTSAAYVQVLDGQVVAAWRDHPVRGDDAFLSVHVTNPLPDINRLYHGYSLLEQSIEVTAFFLDSWRYNRELINLDYPERVLFIAGEVDKRGLANFNNQINAVSMGSPAEGQLRVPLVTGPAPGKGEDADPGIDVKSIELRPPTKDLSHPELMRMLVALKTAAYRTHPATINFDRDKGGGGGMRLGNESEEAIYAQAEEEGMWGVLDNIADMDTRTILAHVDPDLRLVVLRKPSEAAKVEMAGKKLGACWTMNEVRAEMGLEELDEEHGGDIIPNQAFNSAIQQRAMAAQMAEEGDGGQEGAPPENGQEEEPGAPHGMPTDDEGQVDPEQMGLGEGGGPPAREDVLAAMLGRNGVNGAAPGVNGGRRW